MMIFQIHSNQPIKIISTPTKNLISRVFLRSLQNFSEVNWISEKKVEFTYFGLQPLRLCPLPLLPLSLLLPMRCCQSCHCCRCRYCRCRHCWGCYYSCHCCRCGSPIFSMLCFSISSINLKIVFGITRPQSFEGFTSSYFHPCKYKSFRESLVLKSSQALSADA